MIDEITNNSEEYWVSISDIMSDLMVIFLFVSITYLKDVMSENERITGSM